MQKIYKKDINKLMSILQALERGRTIQFAVTDKEWIDIDSDEDGLSLETLINNPQAYRIKPEIKYYPFASAKECWQEMLKHHPFGWVKIGDWYCTIKEIRPTSTFCHGGGDVFHYEDMVKQITFADGTPFGIKVEE